MKTVGIITFCITNNYGSALQMWALKTVIENMGDYEVHIIPHATVSRIENGFGGKELRDKYQERITKFDDFLKTNFRYTGEYIEHLTLENAPKYDYYIVGSDTIWIPWVVGYDGNFFLDFVGENSKRIAYAPSLAIKNMHLLPKDFFAKYIDKFDFLSVREKCTVEFIEQFTDKEVFAALDPTLLLEASAYDEIIESIDDENYILLYLIYDDSESISYIIELANRLAIKYGMKVKHFVYNMPEYVYGEKGESFSFVGPKEFLAYIKNAKLVLTNSFHGTVFSIIFQKAFYSALLINAKSKIKDLLERLHLEHRILEPTLELKDIKLDMDYFEVIDILQDEKEKSMNYLRKALSSLEDVEGV